MTQENSVKTLLNKKVKTELNGSKKGDCKRLNRFKHCQGPQKKQKDNLTHGDFFLSFISITSEKNSQSPEQKPLLYMTSTTEMHTMHIMYKIIAQSLSL